MENLPHIFIDNFKICHPNFEKQWYMMLITHFCLVFLDVISKFKTLFLVKPTILYLHEITKYFTSS